MRRSFFRHHNCRSNEGNLANIGKILLWENSSRWTFMIKAICFSSYWCSPRFNAQTNNKCGLWCLGMSINHVTIGEEEEGLCCLLLSIMNGKRGVYYPLLRLRNRIYITYFSKFNNKSETKFVVGNYASFASKLF